MTKKQLGKLCLSAAILISGLGGGTSANAVFCTPCYPTGAIGPFVYWQCNAGMWGNMAPMPTMGRCTSGQHAIGCVFVAANPNPHLPPAVIPPGC
jgi:hypothetical protein